MAISFDWIARSTTTGVKLTDGRFWLHQNTLPVQASTVPASKVGSWHVDAFTGLAVVSPRAGVNELTVPSDTTYVRVDITLTVSAKGVTKTGLEIRQLFLVGSGGALMPSEYALDDRPWTASAAGPTRGTVSGPFARRRVLGLHPLLSPAPGGFAIDARFIDLTELWWATHTDAYGRYQHPVLKGRMDNLHVLGWTGGDLPTIWFAVVSDLAVQSLAVPAGAKTRTAAASDDREKSNRAPADIVWFRPPAGFNSFAYSATLGGFENAKHDTTTWLNLSRWLLSPAPKDKVAAVRSLVNFEEVLDQIQRPAKQSSTPVADAMAAAWSHRPVGLERVISRTGLADVVFLPLGADTAQGYSAATRSGLAGRVEAARRLLWSVGAVGRRDVTPLTKGRALWAAAHSGANFSLATALAANAATIDRMISHEASGSAKPLDALIAVVTAESRRRKLASIPPLETVFIVTPHMTGNSVGLTTEVRKKIDATGAKVLHIPDPAAAVAYWRIPPVAKTPAKARGILGTASASEMIEDSSNPYMRYLFEQFSEDELFDNSGKPRVDFRNFRIWLVHEMAVFAGDLDPLPPSSPPDPPRTTRTFVEASFAPY